MEKVTVIGIGKLGLCFALNLEQSGFEVLGVDLAPAYVASLNDKTHTSFEPQVEELLKASQHFRATTQLQEIVAFDAPSVFIAVATPTLEEGGYDHSLLDQVINDLINLGPTSSTKDLVVVATTLPGYCDLLAEKVAPLGYTLSYNPEFISQGTIIRDQQYPDQVLIGEANKAAGNRIEAIYRQVVKNEPRYCRMSRLSAEICKLATNCFLTTKISFANSIGDLATKVGAEPDKILAAIGADSRIGGKYLGYGFGYGGPCFPRDNRALGKYARDNGYELLISQATDEVNRRHLDFQTQEWLASYPASEAIFFDTVTYKPGSILLEESQQLALAVKLARAGRKVVIKERPIVIAELKAEYGDLFEYVVAEG